MKSLIFALGLLLLALGVNGCGRSAAQQQPVIGGGVPQPGAPCRVQLRRDAAGLVGFQPPAVTAGTVTASVDGRLRTMNGEWIVIESGRSDFWIPREVVFLIEFYQ